MEKDIEITGHADIIRLSQAFWYAVRTGGDPTPCLDSLRMTGESALAEQLPNDAAKKAFWINIYNAHTQLQLFKHRELYPHRGKFFNTRFVLVAGHRLSLDDIEHGILRRSKLKWSGGYLNKCFPGKFEKQFRVDKLDCRIHFALNCGAKSCPPIAFYEPSSIDRQLDMATANYLQTEAAYDGKHNILKLPALMSWFRADFGGKKGMLKLLIHQGILPPGKRPKLRFNPYDWTLYLDHYKQ